MNGILPIIEKKKKLTGYCYINFFWFLAWKYIGLIFFSQLLKIVIFSLYVYENWSFWQSEASIVIFYRKVLN